MIPAKLPEDCTETIQDGDETVVINYQDSYGNLCSKSDAVKGEMTITSKGGQSTRQYFTMRNREDPVPEE